MGLYPLPFKVLPRTMINFLALRVTKNRSYFPKKTGISSIFSPYTILKCKQIDFNKEFLHSFGDYVQATDNKSPKTNNITRSIDAIYLRVSESLQGVHEMMDLATGRMFTRPQVKVCTMTRMVIERVELLAEKQGYKTLKFFNRKRKEMMLQDTELLAGVGVGEHTILDEGYAPFPLLENGDGVVDDPAEELDGDKQSITNEDISKLLSDAK